MRLLALASLVAGVMAVDVQKSVIVTYPDGTPNSVLDQAKKAITDAGGVITHEYNLVKYAPGLPPQPPSSCHRIRLPMSRSEVSQQRPAKRCSRPSRHGASSIMLSLRTTRL